MGTILITESERAKIKSDLRQALHLFATLLLAERNYQEKTNGNMDPDPEPTIAA